MAAPMKRVVGWSSRSEWIQVYDEIYSGDLQKQRHALDRISVWKCRLNRMSTAIECTWDLLSAELQYQSVKEEGTILEQDRALRIYFSMALIRFINLITEKGQMTVYAQPVHHLADDLGLPKWMVCLRHDAVHSNIPSLAVLRSGVQLALSWLKEVYWEAQLEEEDPELVNQVQPAKEIPASETIESVTQILEAYSKQYFESLSRNCGDARQLRHTLDDLEKAIPSNREAALSAILEDGLLLNTEEQLDALNAKEGLKDMDLSLPEQLISMWSPVLKVIHHLRSTHKFLLLLFSQKPDCNVYRLRQAMGWAMEILRARDENDNTRSEDRTINIYRNIEGDKLNYKRLLRTCLENPNCYTCDILPVLLRQVKPRLSQVQEARLKTLTAIYTRERSEEEGSEGEETKDMDTAKIYSLENLDFGSKPLEWKECPLGYSPAQRLTYTSLELPEHVNSLSGPNTSTNNAPITLTPIHKTPKKRNGKHHRGKSSDVEEDIVSRPSKCTRNTDWTPEELRDIKNQVSLF